MSESKRVLIALLLAASAIAVTIHAAETVEAFEERITSELRAISPAAADLFIKATRSRKRGDNAEAIVLYRRVLELTPSFHHARRRLGLSLVATGEHDGGLQLCRQALQQAQTQENRAAVIFALSDYGNKESAPPSDWASAQTLATRVLRSTRAGPEELFAAFLVALGNRDAVELRLADARFAQLAPDHYYADFVRWAMAMSDGNLGAANDCLGSARRHGMPDGMYRQMKRDTRRAESMVVRYGRWAVYSLGYWTVLFLLLLLAGLGLSAITRHTSERIAEGGSNARVDCVGMVQTCYRALLWGSCVFYYLSIVMLLLIFLFVSVIFGSTVFRMIATGFVPIKLIIIFGILVAVTFWAVVKSLFVCGSDEDPGARLDLSAQPRLRLLLDQVANDIGTRPVDSVYLVPGSEFAVLERGGLRQRLSGHTERCLILGLAAIDSLPLVSFKSILAHEYGHFVNRDTAGGSFALAVRRSLLTMAENLARAGVNHWFNPFWQFLNLFYRVFLRISHGASRLQEVLADRRAALAYGAAAFEAGLSHVISQSVRFRHHLQTVIEEVVQTSSPLVNLYTYRPATLPDQQTIDNEVRQAFEEPPSAYDSHPPYAQRVVWVRRINASSFDAGLDGEPDTWSVLDHREDLERLMTSRIRHNVNVNHNLNIHGS